MNHKTDIRAVETALYFLPVKTRVPLKFGTETLEEVTCARVRVVVTDRNGKTAAGWGETPLSVQWVWPSPLPYAERLSTLKNFCISLAEAIASFDFSGHPLEVGIEFQESVLRELLQKTNQSRARDAAMPWLAALVCLSAFDLALHDAFGQLHQRLVFSTLNAEFLNHDLGKFLDPATEKVSFAKKYPENFLLSKRREQLAAWHLVGGLDPLTAADLTGAEPNDGYPVLLADWIRTDGLTCLKVKLRGNDALWDFTRLAKVGKIGLANGAQWFTADFNCTVREPDYVNEILDRLQKDEPQCHARILYVEQPFPYELEHDRIDVRSVAARKPLFLDESAHDWRMVRLGRELGWTGVALKTCKTLSGALLAACWAQAHGMSLMVQDLTNPMLAQIPHVLLAAHVNTIMGVETNGMQFYPEASTPEAAVHPGIYRRRNGEVNLASIHGAGFGYRLDEIKRMLPEPVARF
ncbi:MAG TPA: mandelate racemase/muconate lactonizing enzyme family protein [Verrucomicrobiae bacterium]|nr:mandelate racemase/muconate lactonizing enzyme family protein [Verrucomicrobiae bacterium]